MSNTPNFYLPLIWQPITDQTNFYGWDFLKPLIGHEIFWASVNWANCQEKNLPRGYQAYVVKTEGPNVEWIEQQAQRVDAPIFYCCLYKDYGTFDHLSNVHFVPVIEWHYQLNNMAQVYGAQVKKNIKHKVSALCHRGTQSKIVALSALAQYIGLEHCLVSLHSVNDRDVHEWQATQNITVDQCIEYFLTHFQNKNILIDQFQNKNLIQVHDFHHPAWLDSAVNINNESFHYSYMTSNGQTRTNPGPFVTEKTLKCLLAETAFINNGQYDTYNTLSSLGFKFDYGLDLSYDQDPGNISRLDGMVNTIKQLSKYTALELYHQTRESCQHNKDYIISGDFYRRAETVNEQATQTMLSLI